MSYLVKKECKPAQNNIYDEIFNSFFQPIRESYTSSAQTALDVKETNDSVYVKVEVPGVDKADIQLEYHDGTLTISGQKKNEKSESNENFVHKEISYGSFSRRVFVGDIDYEKADASYENGVLTISLPKSEEKKAKKLLIN